MHVEGPRPLRYSPSWVGWSLHLAVDLADLRTSALARISLPGHPPGVHLIPDNTCSWSAARANYTRASVPSMTPAAPTRRIAPVSSAHAPRVSSTPPTRPVRNAHRSRSPARTTSTALRAAPPVPAAPALLERPPETVTPMRVLTFAPPLHHLFRHLRSHHVYSCRLPGERSTARVPRVPRRLLSL